MKSITLDQFRATREFVSVSDPDWAGFVANFDTPSVTPMGREILSVLIYTGNIVIYQLDNAEYYLIFDCFEKLSDSLGDLEQLAFENFG